MPADRTTEAISHFIGIFALKVEQARLRDSYDEFTAARGAVELVPVEPRHVEIDTGYQLRKSNAGPKEPDQPGENREALFDVPRWHAPDDPDLPVRTPPLERSGEIDDVAGPALILVPSAPPIPVAGVPGSILTVTVQVARLHDNDIVGSGAFRDAAVHAADLAALASVAAGLHAPPGLGPAQIPTIETALTLHAAMQGFAASAPNGGETFTWLGTSVPQKIVNGGHVEDVPDWKDLLPRYHQETDEAPRLEDWELPPTHRPNPDGPEGHAIVAGGNLLANEASIALSYVDAPLIAVGGTWISLGIVSQVALVSNHDEGLTIGDEGATAVYQIVEVENVAKTASWTIAGMSGPDAPPMRLSVEIVEGDLLVSNYIEQIIELFDNDAFGMSITGANSPWILGANLVVNATSLVTAGFGYDLILIGGNFISIDTIHQTLVLLDDDRIDAGEAGETPVTAGLHTDAALAIEGRADASEGISGNIDRPGPVEGETSAKESTADPAPDNLLVNKALLKTVGIDTAADLPGSLAGILAHPTDDLAALREKLLNDPALAGLEQARVLKINGDLILSNTIKQTIFAADRDDILVIGGAPPGLDIVAGQNAMLNAASISLWGVDSKVMTQNEVYSDLLIHQARLVDEPAVRDTGFIPEAIAFLMDDIDAAVAGKTADTAGKAHLAAADAYDLMQTSLT